MLVILISLIIGAIFIICSAVDDNAVLFLIGALVAVIGVLAGMSRISVPTNYGEWELVKRTEIVTLSNSIETQGGGFLYVSVSGENVYTYRYKIDSELGTDTSTEYEVDTISGNVIESEDPNCKVPELLEYRRWTRGRGTDIKYIFYVPEGTISHEVQLK